MSDEKKEVLCSAEDQTKCTCGAARIGAVHLDTCAISRAYERSLHPSGECCLAGRCDGPGCACACHPRTASAKVEDAVIPVTVMREMGDQIQVSWTWPDGSVSEHWLYLGMVRRRATPSESLEQEKT